MKSGETEAIQKIESESMKLNTCDTRNVAFFAQAKVLSFPEHSKNL